MTGLIIGATLAALATAYMLERIGPIKVLTIYKAPGNSVDVPLMPPTRWSLLIAWLRAGGCCWERGRCCWGGRWEGVMDNKKAACLAAFGGHFGAAGLPTLRGSFLNLSKSARVMMYRPPIFCPSLPCLQYRRMMRGVKFNSAAAWAGVKSLVKSSIIRLAVPHGWLRDKKQTDLY